MHPMCRPGQDVCRDDDDDDDDDDDNGDDDNGDYDDDDNNDDDCDTRGYGGRGRLGQSVGRFLRRAKASSSVSS